MNQVLDKKRPTASPPKRQIKVRPIPKRRIGPPTDMDRLIKFMRELKSLSMSADAKVNS